MTRHYDLIVLGTGSGASIVDDRVSHLRVAIVERGAFGGTCLNRGCIPSKMYVYPADLGVAAERGPALGVRSRADGVDWETVRRRVLARVDGSEQESRKDYEGKDSVDVLVGTARFTGQRRIEVELESGGTVELTADQVVVATGGRPVVPDVPGLHDVPHHTSDTVMRMERLPERVTVLGGGYVGSELAHVLSTYGALVTQVDAAPLLLTNQDEEVSRRFTDAVSRRWDVRLGTELERVEPGTASGSVSAPATLHLSDGTRVEADAVLVAVGRRPNSDDLGLEAAGVAVDDDGRIVVDAHQRTSADGVWALGDVTDGVPLKHVANQDARVVQHNLLHPDDPVRTRHDGVPNAVFAHPQVGSVGLTEAEARDQGYDVVVGRCEMSHVARGWAMQSDPDDDSPDANGLVKLVADRASGRLLGGHVVGDQASILVHPLVMAVDLGLRVPGLARSHYWVHPALTEVLEQALLDLEEAGTPWPAAD